MDPSPPLEGIRHIIYFTREGVVVIASQSNTYAAYTTAQEAKKHTFDLDHCFIMPCFA